MEPYEKLYHITFNAITDALEQLDEMNIGRARRTLREAQSQAEELYISQEDASGGQE